MAAIAILLAGGISEPHQSLNSTHGNARMNVGRTLIEEPLMFPQRMAFAHIRQFLRGPFRGSSVEPARCSYSGRQIADVCGAHSPVTAIAILVAGVISWNQLSQHLLENSPTHS